MWTLRSTAVLSVTWARAVLPSFRHPSRLLALLCLLILAATWSTIVIHNDDSPDTFLLATHQQHIGTTDQRHIQPLAIPQWIHHYTRWHAHALTQPAQHKFLVYRCTDADVGGCGGIGDRIRGMLSLFYIAIASNRVFLIESSKPFPLSDTLAESLVQWSFPPPLDDNQAWIYSIDRNDSALVEPARLLHSPKRIVYVQYNYFSDAMLWRSIRQHLQPQPQSVHPPPPQLFKWAFHALFRKAPAVQRRIEAIRFQTGLAEPYVGVHIRTGNGTTWVDQLRHHSKADVDLFLQCARRMQQLISADSHHSAAMCDVFLASDNDAVKERCRATMQSIRTADAVIYHNDRTEGERRAREANVDAWSEMFLLSEANCVVASRSRFSQVAIAISVSEPAGGRCWAWFDECDVESVGENLLPPSEVGVSRTLGYINMDESGYFGEENRG